MVRLADCLRSSVVRLLQPLRLRVARVASQRRGRIERLVQSLRMRVESEEGGGVEVGREEMEPCIAQSDWVWLGQATEFALGELRCPTAPGQAQTE